MPLISISLLVHGISKYSEIIPEDKENSEFFIENVISDALSATFDEGHIQEIDVDVNLKNRQITDYMVPVEINAKVLFNTGEKNPQVAETLALLLEGKFGQTLLELFEGIKFESLNVQNIENLDRSITVNPSGNSEIKVGAEPDIKHKTSSNEKTTESTEHRSSLKLSIKPSPESIGVSKTLLTESTVLRIRIMEEPLTTYNLTTILSSITELHTKCWLIAHNRFADLIEYTQTHNERFSKEANLVIVQMTHNSPADIKMNINADASMQGLAEALKTGIDAITQAPHRRKAAELENQASELAIKLKELEVQLIQAEREQNLQTAVQEADLNKQKKLLELEQQRIELENKRIELEKRRLELQSERLDLMTKSVNFALEVAGKMVDILHPGIDAATRAMLVQTLIPNLLQVANGQELKVALPEPKKEENK